MNRVDTLRRLRRLYDLLPQTFTRKEAILIALEGKIASPSTVCNFLNNKKFFLKVNGGYKKI
jgi:hypothetical protein